MEGVHRLHPNFELHCARGKAGEHGPQRRRQAIGNHFKMDEKSGTKACQEKLKDRFSDVDIEIKSAVNEFELADTPVKQPLHFVKERFEGGIPYRYIQ